MNMQMISDIIQSFISMTLIKKYCLYGTVTVKRMYLSNEMKQKLNNMINKGIRRNNQEFVINEITIADVDEDLFEKNQCDLIISNGLMAL